MPEYDVAWYPTNVVMREEPRDFPEVAEHLNARAAQGWEVLQVVPGTNASTYGGLFVTYVRQRRTASAIQA